MVAVDQAHLLGALRTTKECPHGYRHVRLDDLISAAQNELRCLGQSGVVLDEVLPEVSQGLHHSGMVAGQSLEVSLCLAARHFAKDVEEVVGILVLSAEVKSDGFEHNER